MRQLADALFMLVIGVSLGRTLSPDSLWISGALVVLASVVVVIRVRLAYESTQQMRGRR